jgi:Domain of unknown function (DUF4145)
MATFVVPAADIPSFTCPHCDTLAGQSWGNVFVDHTLGMKVGHCHGCGKYTLWDDPGGGPNDWVLVYPDRSPAPPPNEDLPDDIKSDYQEAADILNRSPKGAAALLRLCVQKLCIHLGQPGNNVNDDIATLVKDGLSPLIQQAMDTVRITGNEAVHPGEINLDDEPELALELFHFVNLIAEHTITTPKRVKQMYDRLPQAKRDAVEKRDAD